MKDFKKLPKMQCGGKIKKYSGADGSYVTADDIIGAARSGKFVDRMPVPKRSDGTNPALSRAIGAPEDSKYIDRMPTPRGNPDGVDVPGYGRIKPVATPRTRGDAMLLKKGGKAKKKK